jgi:hypothetical protein
MGGGGDPNNKLGLILVSNSNSNFLRMSYITDNVGINAIFCIVVPCTSGHRTVLT